MPVRNTLKPYRSLWNSIRFIEVFEISVSSMNFTIQGLPQKFRYRKIFIEVFLFDDSSMNLSLPGADEENRYRNFYIEVFEKCDSSMKIKTRRWLKKWGYRTKPESAVWYSTPLPRDLKYVKIIILKNLEESFYE